ncbi:MAG: primosomal protein N', partial [Planctomycetaceae bacterium]|nr:primosomal protein N' [Planctomycetaceae bacterium]
MARQGSLFDWEPEPSSWEIADQKDCLVAQVVFNRPLDTIYSYLVPESLRELISPGQRVTVPFGRGDSRTTGYCVGLSTDSPTNRRLKTLLEVCDRDPLLSAPMLELTRWIGERYLCGWGQVLEAVIPAGVKKQAGTREITAFGLNPEIDLDRLKLTAKQRAVIAVLSASDLSLPAPLLAELAQCGTSPIRTLEKKGILIPERRRSDVSEADWVSVQPQDDLKLNDEQRACLDRILELVRNQEHRTVLMHGVTGSGKTEVYIQAIREIVSYGQQAIVLVPEISLTPQTIRRFRARFDTVAVLHSHLSDADRHWHWQQIAQGQVQVIVGARSAVFAPVPHLGLIIIDEEHETTFKQQTTPRYHACEVARERARQANVPLILGSATPTLESLRRAQLGDDLLLTLKNRVESRPMPPVTLVDTRNDPFVTKGHSIGRALGQAIQRSLHDRGQVILFLNLRGYSPVLWCMKCQGIRCPDCDMTLTWHRDPGVMMCHSCEFQMPPPERCPKCDQPGLRYLGSGTQRLEAEVKNKFPDARIVRMDSDSMKKVGSHDEVLERFREGRIDILLGTQMIAKGLD